MNDKMTKDQRLLLAVKMEEATEDLVGEIAQIDLNELQSNLRDDEFKKSFWINIYNAFFQILRKKEIEKPEIFRSKLVELGETHFSLDDIEHGILRRHRWKFSKGYLANPFASSLIKGLAVDSIDYRIHFALNCGAKSCPPIAFYDPERIDEQLDVATLSFLESETDVDEAKKKVHVSALFSWFAADFGSRSGTLKILSEKLDRDLDGFSLVFKEYSWEEDLGNFSD